MSNLPIGRVVREFGVQLGGEEPGRAALKVQAKRPDVVRLKLSSEAEPATSVTYALPRHVLEDGLDGIASALGDRVRVRPAEGGVEVRLGGDLVRSLVVTLPRAEVEAFVAKARSAIPTQAAAPPTQLSAEALARAQGVMLKLLRDEPRSASSQVLRENLAPGGLVVAEDVDRALANGDPAVLGRL